MRRLLALTARLYPRRWRARYGPEFDALMEEVEPDWRELANVLGGALKMQMRSERAYLKLAALLAVIGAVAALGMSTRVGQRYVSSAELKYTVPPDADPQSTVQWMQLQQEILSRTSLTELISRPSFNLYKGERQRMPMYDVVRQMRHDILIEPASATGGPPGTVKISFTYPDAFLAQTVATELVKKFTETNTIVNRNRIVASKRAWNEDAPPTPSLDVISPPSDPRSAGNVNRLLFAGIGILVGVLAAAIWWRPKTALRLAAFAAGGCMIAAAASWLLPNRYVSFATLRIIPAIAPKGWYARHQFEPVDRLRHLEFVALGLPSLQEIIQRPSLDLYRDERTRRPIADVAAAMRKGDIRTEVVPPGYFKIWFSYGDRFKAQAVVREFVTRFMETNVTEERERTKREGPEFKTMADHKLGENLEVLDPATLPEEPIWPDRLRIALAGLGAGLLLGIVTLWLRRPRDPAPEAAVPSVA